MSDEGKSSWGAIATILLTVIAVMLLVVTGLLTAGKVISLNIMVLLWLLIAFVWVAFVKVIPLLADAIKAHYISLSIDDPVLSTPALLERLDELQETEDIHDVKNDVGYLWRILRHDLGPHYKWTLPLDPPIHSKWFRKPEHQFFATMISRDHTGRHTKIVEVLNLRATKAKDIVWVDSIPVTSFKEFIRMVNSGDFDWKKRSSHIPLNGLNLQAQLK